jgi:general secretion pathway protein A
MYTAHYNLKETPFDQSVDPKFTWLNEKQLEDLAAFKQDYLAKKGLFLITGDAGTGKTTFAKRLLAEIEPKSFVATVTDPGLDKLDFFNWLSLEFELDVIFKSKGAFLTRFKRFLLEANQRNINVTLIIDDAHRINQELFNEILTLSNIEKAGDKLMGIFLVGQSGFNKILQEKQNSTLRQCIRTHFHLKPLKEDEIVQLILYRLKVAGAKAEIFSPSAYHEIYRFSAGYPRMVITICDRAMIAGCVSATHVVDKEIIIECAKDLQIAGIKRDLESVDRFEKIAPAGLIEAATIKDQNQGIKKSLFGNWKIKIASAARTAMLPVALSILVVIAIYFVFHFKSTLLSWAGLTLHQENSTSVQGESSILNVTPEKGNKSEIDVRQPVNEDEIQIPTEGKRAELSSDADVLDDLKIDETNIGSDNQPAPSADELSAQTTVVDDLSDADVHGESLPITSDAETAPRLASEEKVNQLSPEKMDTITAQLPLAATEIETERELADREFKMLSRRLALKSKLSHLERQEVPIQEIHLEPKIGRLTTAEPAGDSEARMNLHSPQLLAKKLYLPEKERPEADIQTIDLAARLENASDAVPTDELASRENLLLGQSVAKMIGLPVEEGAEADPSRTVPVDALDEGIKSTLPAEESTARIDAASQQPAINQPQTSPPSLKSDLDPITKPEQLQSTELAALGQVNKEEGLRNRQELKERLHSFLENYCHTYESKDLDHFSTFFAPDAQENDKPFHNLLPKYRQNFNAIDFINYRIEMKKYYYDEKQGTIHIEGRFFLEWLPGGTKWKRNSGKIFMELQESGTSFRISRLDYYGDQRKKSR